MLRALIVEDNHIFRETFKMRLNDHFPSIVVGEASNGDEALRKLDEIRPDLIFMDVRLPGANGLQLTQKIKKDLPGIHIAILTDYDFVEYRQAALEYGADRFFVKSSFNWDEVDTLVKTIREVYPPPSRCDISSSCPNHVLQYKDYIQGLDISD